MINKTYILGWVVPVWNIFFGTCNSCVNLLNRYTDFNTRFRSNRDLSSASESILEFRQISKKLVVNTGENKSILINYFVDSHYLEVAFLHKTASYCQTLTSVGEIESAFLYNLPLLILSPRFQQLQSQSQQPSRQPVCDKVNVKKLNSDHQLGRLKNFKVFVRNIL